MMQHKGFTLIELVIVVVILAVLVALALPSYQSYVLRSNRVEAISALLAVSNLEEKYRVNNSSYGSLAAVGGSSTTSSGYYTISVSNTSATSYTVTATAVSGSVQADDTGCTSIVLQVSNGVETKTPSSCWD